MFSKWKLILKDRKWIFSNGMGNQCLAWSEKTWLEWCVKLRELEDLVTWLIESLWCGLWIFQINIPTIRNFLITKKFIKFSFTSNQPQNFILFIFAENAFLCWLQTSLNTFLGNTIARKKYAYFLHKKSMLQQFA